jgi:site-specific DNA-methyltransferase (adenine-specific)
MNVKLFCGETTNVLASLEAASVDFVFSDPPYFLSNDGFSIKSGKMISVNKGEWDRSSGFTSDLSFNRDWISQSLRLLKPNGTIAISGTYHNIFQCGFLLQEQGCRILNDIVWFKPNGAPSLAGRNFTASHETIIWASKSITAKHTFNYQVAKNWDSSKDLIKRPGKQMRSVWSIPTTPRREKLEGKHPTQKPLELMKRLIASCTNPGDVVLDPFCGSGSTGVAALSLGRSFIGIDFDPDYINLTKRRIDGNNAIIN